MLAAGSRKGSLRNNQISIFIVNFLSEQLDEDAPGGPGIADFPSAHGVFVDFEQFLNDIAHAEEVELPTAVFFY